MADKKSKRYIKIEALCDQCEKLHTSEGVGGISAVLVKKLPTGGFEIAVNFMAIASSEELLNLVAMLMQATFKTNPGVMLQALEILMKTPGVAQAVMERRLGQSMNMSNGKPKLEGIN